MSNPFREFWLYLKKDSWDSWLASILLAFLLIRFVFFPLMSFFTGSPLPLVVVESCSMYHSTDFDDWWDKNQPWYQRRNIDMKEFSEFPFKGGLNKGDIILVWGRGDYELGDIIIFQSEFQHPLIHRIVTEDPTLSTKGDNNVGQLEAERDISEQAVLGEAVARVPLVGWLKLIFFEGFKSPDQRGFCK